MTEKIWYIARRGQQHGPITEMELSVFVKEGYLLADDLIWRQGLPDWVRAEQLETLLDRPSKPGSEALGPASDAADAKASAAPEMRSKDDAEAGPFDAMPEPGPRLRAPAEAAPGQAEAAASASSADAAPRGKRSSAGFVRWALLAVSIVAGAAGAYWFLVTPKSLDKDQERIAAIDKAEPAPKARAAPQTESAPEKEGASQKESAPRKEKALPKAPRQFAKPKLRRDGKELVIEGGLLAGVADAAKAELEAAPEIQVLRLDSEGGEVYAANELRKLVVERKLVTYSVKGCSGACILPFAAGRQRMLYKDAQLGFHNLPALKNAAEKDAAKAVAGKHYLAGRGVLADFVAKVVSTPTQSMWIPSMDELIEASAIDGFAEAEGFGAAFDDEKSLAAFNGALRRTAFARALEKHEASFLQAILDPKRTAVAVKRAISPRLYSGFYARSMKQNMLSQTRNAPDQAVSRVAELFVARLKKLTKQDSEKCYKYYFSEELGDVDYLKEFTGDEIIEELDVWVAVLVGTKTSPQKPPGQQDVQAAMQSVLETLSKKQGEAVKVLADRPAFLSAEMGIYCRVLINLYEIILRAPPEERGKLLRFIFAGGR